MCLQMSEGTCSDQSGAGASKSRTSEQHGSMVKCQDLHHETQRIFGGLACAYIVVSAREYKTEAHRNPLTTRLLRYRADSEQLDGHRQQLASRLIFSSLNIPRVFLAHRESQDGDVAAVEKSSASATQPFVFERAVSKLSSMGDRKSVV